MSLEKENRISFHFQLRPIAEVEPWGKPDDRNLHWFGLSDGWYWIQVGEVELFRYSAPLLARQAQRYPDRAGHPLWCYPDYYVVRLWEDILEIVPDILDPLPAALLQRLQIVDTWLEWCQQAMRWREMLQDELPEDPTVGVKALYEEQREIYNTAILWWEHRQPYTGPILPAPQIHFWRAGDKVHCHWNNQDVLLDGIPVWEAAHGEIVVSVIDFVEAVSSFHTRFIAAMEERVQAVLAHWDRLHIKLDLEQLVQEHALRAAHLAKRMAEIPRRAKTAAKWGSILDAIAAIETRPDFVQCLPDQHLENGPARL